MLVATRPGPVYRVVEPRGVALLRAGGPIPEDAEAVTVDDADTVVCDDALVARLTGPGRSHLVLGQLVQ